MTGRPVVFSGMQPTGELHLGNLLGALRPWVAEQRDFRNFFCVVDLHALTAGPDPATLAAKTRSVAALYLAAGIDPSLSAVLVQSHLSEHSELAWILGCVLPVGWLERMTQFKDKSKRSGAERINTGLLTYPVLMAADILLYRADYVTVGDDQRQHLELTVHVAERFNRRYGETFMVPKPRIGLQGSVARVMALDDPDSKMSKSAQGEAGRIGLLDPPEVVRAKFMRAKTDSSSSVEVESATGGVRNLLDIYQALSNCSGAELRSRFEGVGYGKLKADVAELTTSELGPIQERYRDLISDPAAIDRILAAGAEAARAVASSTLDQVRSKVGLLPSGRC